MKDKRRRTDDQPEAPEATHTPEESAAEDLPPLQAERDDLLGRLQRVSADYLNYQRRAQRDMEEARDQANTELIRSLLSVLDDMELAMEAARKNHEQDDPLLAGMQLVHDKALEILGKFGLSPMEAVGKPFDPDKHQAMLMEPTDEHPPQTVIRELQKGYELKGRPIRPARVVVATASQVEEPAGDASEQEAQD